MLSSLALRAVPEACLPAEVIGTAVPEAPLPTQRSRGFKPAVLTSAAATCAADGARHQNGSCEPVVSWVTPSTFRAGPQMPRTSLNYSLNESLFSAINDFNYRPFKCGCVVAMPNLCKSWLSLSSSNSNFLVF